MLIVGLNVKTDLGNHIVLTCIPLPACSRTRTHSDQWGFLEGGAVFGYQTPPPHQSHSQHAYCWTHSWMAESQVWVVTSAEGAKVRSSVQLLMPCP